MVTIATIAPGPGHHAWFPLQLLPLAISRLFQLLPSSGQHCSAMIATIAAAGHHCLDSFANMNIGHTGHFLCNLAFLTNVEIERT